MKMTTIMLTPTSLTSVRSGVYIKDVNDEMAG
jgi:hypothetical protein